MTVRVPTYHDTGLAVARKEHAQPTGVEMKAIGGDGPSQRVPCDNDLEGESLETVGRLDHNAS
jgi:hypothetical protein